MLPSTSSLSASVAAICSSFPRRREPSGPRAGGSQVLVDKPIYRAGREYWGRVVQIRRVQTRRLTTRQPGRSQRISPRLSSPARP